MNFQHMEGNEKLAARLTAAIKNGHVSHAYIFEGEAVLDKAAFAACFVKAILCREEPGIGCGRCLSCRKVEHGNHEDLTYVEAVSYTHLDVYKRQIFGGVI